MTADDQGGWIRCRGLLLPCRVTSRTVWHTGVAGLVNASVLAWILWRLAEQRFARPPGAQQIAQRDQPDKDHNPAGNPRQSNHGCLPNA
jgi:hypothetical protein